MDNTSKARILVVDDEPSIRLLVRNVLEYSGFHVADAGSAEEALGIFRRESASIDLLISDVVMPGLSGVDLAREVRKARPTLPILLISGFCADFEDGIRGFETMPKPFNPSTLVQKATELTSAGRGEPS